MAVSLGGSDPDWHSFAAGYKAAADVLVDHLNDRGIVAEHVCLPILFMYRHFVELSLKALLVDLGDLIAFGELAPKGHGLKPLWERFSSRLSAAHLGEPGTNFAQLQAWVFELEQLDSGSFTFRYPVDTVGIPLRGLRQDVDMHHIRAVLDELAGFFGGCAAVIGDHLALRREIEEAADYRSYYSEFPGM